MAGAAQIPFPSGPRCSKPTWHRTTDDARCLFFKQTQFSEILVDASRSSTYLFVLSGKYWMVVVVEIRGGGAQGSCVCNLIRVCQSESERKMLWAVNRIWPLLLLRELNAPPHITAARGQGDCFCD